jgi:hypothetical protein
MLDKLKSVLTWPVVTLLSVGAAIFAAIAIFAPPDVRAALFGAHGLLFTLIALFMQSPGASGDKPGE